MKHLKLFEELINEIGDASAKPYKWKWTNPNYRTYSTFKTDSGLQYEVNTDIVDNTDWDGGVELTIEYGVDTKASSGATTTDYKVVTNRGEMFRVMATIVDIVKTLLKKRPDVEFLEFQGSKNKDGDQRRNKLYMAYINKHLKPKNIEDDGTTITVEL